MNNIPKMPANNHQKVEQMGLRYLNYRPRTVWEMRNYLHRQKCEQHLIEYFIGRWQELGYLDDLAFSSQWFQERIRTKKKGHLLLREELKQKGVSANVIEQAMQDIDQREELNACLALAQKKLKSYRDLEEYKAKGKLYQYLQRRGFPLELIDEVYQRIKS